MRDQHRFAHHGMGAAGTSEAGDGRKQMEKQDGQVAHRWILPRSPHQLRMSNFGIRHAHVVARQINRKSESAATGRYRARSKR
jgi:hypothetical protein